MKIYKYKSLAGDGLSHVLDMVVKNRLYLPTWEQMNDIEEGDLNLPESGWTADAPTREQLHKVRSLVDAQRFCSFCPFPTQVLLWGHYGGGFDGVAVEYDFPDKMHDADGAVILPIIYEPKPKLTKATVEALLAGTKQPYEVGLVRHKRANWSYEREYRLYVTPKHVGRFYDITPSAIIFGVGKNDKGPLALVDIAKKFGVPCKYLNGPRDGDTEFRILDPRNPDGDTIIDREDFPSS